MGEVGGRRSIAASVVGTVVEAYDFALYGLGAALVFGRQFFPAGSAGTGVLASLATFAVGFLVRPVGGMALSHYGDRFGRRPLLVVTLLMMGTATLGIGLLPTYDTVGVAAPLLLVLLRLLQGFGAGAEYVGAILLASESGTAPGRGLRASLPGAGFFAGVVLATVVFAAVAAMPAASFAAWGWRVPFLLSVVTLAVGLYVRLAAAETTAFRRAQAAGLPSRFPLAEVIADNWRRLLLIFAANGPSVAIYYLIQVFLLSYLTGTLGMPSTVGLLTTTTALVGAMVTTPLFGALADRIGRRPVWLAGAAFLVTWAYPLVWLVETKRPVLVAIAFTMAALGLAATAAAQASLFPELFATRYRLSAVVLARESSAALIAGPAPAVAAVLLRQFGGLSWPIPVLIMLLGATSFVAVLLMPETRHVDLTRM